MSRCAGLKAAKHHAEERCGFEMVTGVVFVDNTAEMWKINLVNGIFGKHNTAKGKIRTILDAEAAAAVDMELSCRGPLPPVPGDCLNDAMSRLDSGGEARGISFPMAMANSKPEDNVNNEIGKQFRGRRGVCTLWCT